MKNSLSPKVIPFRRQYVLAPKSVNLFDNYKEFKVADNHILTTQEDLEVTQYVTENKSITLIGFFLDPQSPYDTNQQILDRIAANSNSFSDIIKQTTPLAGKWAVIYYSNSEGINIFNDLVGSRQVYYTHTKTGEFWAASQPHTLAKLTNKSKTTNSEKLSFVESKQYEFTERAWIGSETIYDDIHHLLPNHFIAEKLNSQSRFWPTSGFEPVQIEDIVGEFSETLKGILKAANNRKKLLLAISAGWDSRLLLAASKDIINDCYCYVQKFDDLTNKSADIYIPQKLSSQLGFEFHVHETSPCPPEFNDAVEKSVATAQSEKKKVLYYDFFKRFTDEVNISGVVGEIFRSRFGPKRPLNAGELVDLFGRSDSKYALQVATKWIKDLKSSPAIESNINFWDLFYWEQYIGNWGVAGQAGQDVAIEEFFPLNCRALIELTYGLESLPYQDSPLFLASMKEMWPEVLNEPINPKTKVETVIYIIKKVLRKAGIFNNVRSIYFQLKKKTS